MPQKHVELLYSDICEPDSVDKAFNGIDCVLHLAGAVNTDMEEKYKIINVNGTKNLVFSAKKHDAQKFVFSSSCLAAEAGEAKSGASGKSKRMAEELIKQSSLPYTIFRTSVPYGENDNKNITNLIRLVKKYPVVPIVSSSNAKFQPIYVKDVVQAIICSLEIPQSTNKIYNLAGWERLSMGEIVESICKELSLKRLKVSFPIVWIIPLIKIYQQIASEPAVTVEQALRLGTGHRFLDVSKITTELQIELTPFKKGIRLTLEKMSNCPQKT